MRCRFPSKGTGEVWVLVSRHRQRSEESDISIGVTIAKTTDESVLEHEDRVDQSVSRLDT